MVVLESINLLFYLHIPHIPKACSSKNLNIEKNLDSVIVFKNLCSKKAFLKTLRKKLGLCYFCLDFSKKHKQSLEHRKKQGNFKKILIT
jgi:hypothetical protein